MTGAGRANSGRGGGESEVGMANAKTVPPARQERLKAALRANLRRRKSQARERAKEAGGKDGHGPD